MYDVNQNYRPGAIWRTRQDISALGDNKKGIYIPKNSLIFILKIVEEFNLTHLKVLYKNKICYISSIEDIAINFFYESDKVFSKK